MAKDDKSKKAAKKSPKDTDQADLEALEEAMEDVVVVDDDAVVEADDIEVVEEDVVVVADDDEPPAKGKKTAPKATMLAKADDEDDKPAPKRPDKKTKLAGAKPVTMLPKPEPDEENETLLIDEAEIKARKSEMAADATSEEVTEYDMGPEAGASEVNLGGKWSKDKPKSLSGLELDDDSKVSGAKLEMADEDAAASLLAEDSKHAGGEESSAVDLGSTPMLQMPPSGSREDGLKVEGEGEVDLAGLEGETEVKEDSAVALEEEADKDEEDFADRKAAKKPSRALAWIGGTAIGAVVGAAACVGLVYFDVVELNELLGKQPKQASGVGASKPPGGEAPPARSSQEVARDHIARGKYEEALRELEKAGDNAPDKKLVVERAEARLLAHLQKQRETAKPTDEPVKKVTEELKAADPVDALFLQGLALESTGQRSQALAMYQDGLKQAKDARSQKIFQAAVDRLESRSDDRPADKPAENKPAEKE